MGGGGFDIGAASNPIMRSEERRQRSSLAMKGRKPAPQTIEASVKARQNNPEWRKLVGQRSRERGAGLGNSHLHTPEVRARMAATRRSQRELNTRLGFEGLKKWRKWFEYLDPKGRLWKFRSSYERAFAAGMDEMGLTWQYEPHRLLLSDGRTYLPDFWVEEWRTYVEVKGWRGWGRIDKVVQAKADGHPVALLESKPRWWVSQLAEQNVG